MSISRRSTQLGIFMLALVMMFSLALPTALAASGSVSSATVTEGNNVNVTVTFSGGGTSVGTVDAYVSYDSSVLQFVSGTNASGGGGSVHLVAVASNDSQSSFSFTLTFKALKAGSATVSARTNTFLSFDEAEIGPASGSGRVTVNAKVTPTVKPTAKPTVRPTNNPNTTPTPTPTPEPTDIETAIPVTVDGQTLYLWRSLKNVTVALPEGYSANEYTYHDEKIEAGLGESGLVFLWLSDDKGENGAYYLYDETADAFTKLMQLSVSASGSYIILPLPDTLAVPAGYEETTLVVSESLSVPAWAMVKQSASVTTSPAASPEASASPDASAAPSAATPEFYLIYAMNAKGETGFYQYDAVEKTIQRYAGEVAEISPAPTPTPGPEQGEGLFGKIFGDPTLRLVFIALAALCLILLVAVILLAVRNHKGGKPPKGPKGGQNHRHQDWLDDEPVPMDQAELPAEDQSIEGPVPVEESMPASEADENDDTPHIYPRRRDS